MLDNILRRMRGTSTKQLVIASAFVVALAGAVSLGLATKQKTQAATVRECTTNSINYKNINGGCGSATISEYIADLRDNNPSDLQTISKNFTNEFHLAPSEYNDFLAHAKMGMAYEDGRVVVDGQTVLTHSWSIGRHSKPYSTAMNISGAGTFHRSWSRDVFAVNSIPVMVYFAKDGTVQYVAMNPCGNPMGGEKVTSTATCKALNSAPDKSNPNKYTFTTTANFGGNAQLSRVVYTFSDTGETVTKNSLTAPVEHTFKKSGTVTVKVYAKVPGGHEILATTVVDCSKQIKYVPPIAACVSLVATALDDQKRKFRFTVTAKTDKYSKLVSADFTLDSKTTTTGVTDKDNKGNIYKDYAFTDEVKHTVVATVNFTTLEGAKSVKCQASVTPSKLPKCEVPGKEHLPPDSPECAYCEVPGHEDLPKDSPLCKEETPPEKPPVTELPKTGTGSVIGLFAGTSAIGAAAHAVITRRRKS
ncbi:MAG TPA: LPXTG cell wall anchor domain-containing protein [Candidatus Saccharimonadales bacterium]|nr:LPXTG cell wall anchor domain-containing protein [Candidatus Saccharimonadales bacterium]